MLNQKHMTKYLRYTLPLLSDYLGDTKDKTIYLQLRFNSKISQKEYYPLKIFKEYLENPHGQKSLEGYSPWGCKESNTTEHIKLREADEKM